jgi:predicted nucleic acid-binding Zn ribbon protein
MSQVFSPAGVVFKGSGFYHNDSRPAPPKPAKKKKEPEKKKETKNDL